MAAVCENESIRGSRHPRVSNVGPVPASRQGSQFRKRPVGTGPTSLTQCENEVIREGVKAILAQYQGYSENLAAKRKHLGWTARQFADDELLRALQDSQAEWTEYKDQPRRSTAITRFHEYSYQWF